MTWEEFVEVVDSHLAVEANRRGLATFRDRYARNAVLDLQRFIRGYREANYSTFTSGDVAIESHAHLVPMPVGAIPKACYIYSVAEGDDELCRRYRLSAYPWDQRQDMVCGKLNFATWWGSCWPEGGCSATVSDEEAQCWEKKAFVYSISPMGRNMLIYPQLTTSTRLVLIFDGYKYDFEDDDVINFPAHAAEAVASYILWKVTLNVDKKPDLAAIHAADYSRLRLSLFRDFQDTLTADGKDEAYNATNVANMDFLFGFSAHDIPYLGSVTTIEGSTNAALCNLPTLNITTPYVLQVNIEGELQTWVIMTSTAAHDPANGVIRFNDYSVTNTKCGFMNSI